MKVVVACFAAAVVFVVSIPLVFANGGSAAAPYACGQLGVILDTIRTVESGGEYGARNAHASAAGAYQYITSTWTHWAREAGVDVTLYRTADTAPAHVQDRVAGLNVTAILADHDNLVDAIPVSWYYPAAWGDEALMDRVPRPDAGNALTVREYQTKWLALFGEKLAAAEEAGTMVCASTDVTGAWALPAPRPAIDEGTLDDPHHHYPAWDLLLPTGTPIYAVTGGTVANVGTWPHNWWTAGCGTNRPPDGCASCGIGVTIQHPDGLRHTYCHNSAAHVVDGDTVAPGQHIADSGDSGRSGAPHLHLEFRIEGVRHCPQPLLAAVYSGTPIPSPESLPITGCSFIP